MFRAQTPAGVIELTALDSVPEAVVRAVLRTPERDRPWALIELCSKIDSQILIDQLSMTAFNDLISRWEEHSHLRIGELLQLIRLIDKHRDALEADLIDKGLRLRHCPSVDLTWRDLMVIVRHSSVTSHLYTAMFPDRAGWTRDSMLAAWAVDVLQILAWQRTKEGAKGRNKPKQIPRPGVTPPKRDGAKPKASPISVIKERFADRYANAANRIQKLNDVFTGGR